MLWLSLEGEIPYAYLEMIFLSLGGDLGVAEIKIEASVTRLVDLGLLVFGGWGEISTVEMHSLTWSILRELRASHEWESITRIGQMIWDARDREYVEDTDSRAIALRQVFGLEIEVARTIAEDFALPDRELYICWIHDKWIRIDPPQEPTERARVRVIAVSSAAGVEIVEGDVRRSLDVDELRVLRKVVNEYGTRTRELLLARRAEISERE